MSEEKESHWIPLADLMTVLMVIFLFLSVFYIKKIKDQTKGLSSKVKELNEARSGLVEDLNIEFASNLNPNSMASWHAVLDTANLSIKFLDEQILFDKNQDALKPQFKSILNDFLPKFLYIILKPKYKGKIGEVRVEGHTSPEGGYVYNLKLSQNRTANVIAYLYQLPYYLGLSNTDKDELTYLLTANGLSYGRTVNSNNQLTYFSENKYVDFNKSRRVEFRIVMNSEQILNHK